MMGSKHSYLMNILAGSPFCALSPEMACGYLVNRAEAIAVQTPRA